MKKIISGTGFYVLLLSLFSFIHAKSLTYYVSPSGNDNASGTSVANAWKTIAKINSITLSPGTVVLFEGGQTFNGSIYLDQSDANDPNNCVTISSYGTGRAIILSGAGSGFYAYNTQGLAISNLIFGGSDQSTNISDGILFYTDLTGDMKLSDITISNTEVYNYGKTGISLISANGNTGYKDVIIDSVHVHDVKQNGITTNGFTSQAHVGWAHQHIIIRNTEVDHVPGYSDPNSHRGSGIILGQVDGGLIEKTAAHDNGSGNTHCGGPGGIWVWDSNNLTIQSCESYRNSAGSGCDGLGFDLDGGITNSLLQYNYSHDNDGAGYLLGQFDYARPWTNNIIRYNISENDGRTNEGGITLFKGPGTSMSGCKIYNNTIYITPSVKNAAPGALTIMNWNTGITGVDVYNNIFQTTGGAALIDVPAGYDAFFAGNLYWSSGGAFKIKYQGAIYSDLTGWRAATGNEQTGSSQTGLIADPFLLNAGAGGTIFPDSTSQLQAYKLEVNSPAIDAGLNLGTLFSINAGTKDFFNDILYAGSSPDIGAHEWSLPFTTSINANDIIPGKIICYPNPVKSGELIHVKGTDLPYTAELISMNGMSIWKQTDRGSSYSIPTVNLPAGPYILLIIDERGQKRTCKLLIQ